jgi:CheY-like chemotaxis protein
MSADEHITWTRDALAQIYSVPFLHRHAHAAGAPKNVTDGSTLQEALFNTIECLRPAPNTPPQSPTWRRYNILRMRYLEGLLQAEVAEELHLSLRHLKREQELAIEAVAFALFEKDSTQWPVGTQGVTWHAASAASNGEDRAGVPSNLSFIDDALRNALSTLDIILQQHNLSVKVLLEDDLPRVVAEPMALRQLLVSALGWMMLGIVDQSLQVTAGTMGMRDQASAQVVVQLCKPLASGEQDHDSARDEALAVVQRLAPRVPCQMMLPTIMASSTPSSSVNERVQQAPMAMLKLAFDAHPARCVLVIDDDPDVIQLISHHLQHSNDFYALGLTQPSQVMQQVAASRPACILLDLMMPDRDGWELLRQLKTDPHTASIPVIISSVLQQYELAHNLGAYSILPRPFTSVELMATLTSAVGGPGIG